MAKRNSDYWAARNREKLEDIQWITDAEVDELIKIIKKADRDLSDKIRKMYVKYGDDNGLTYPDTLKYLRDGERKEFQKDLQYYIEKYHDTEYVKKNRRELQSLSVRARVKRIEEVQANIKMIVSELNNRMFTGSKESLKQAFDAGYLHTVHALNGMDIQESFSMPNMGDVEELLKIPWSGKNYSDKVWNITDGFEKKLTETLNRGLIQGKHPDEIAREWRKLGMGKDGTGGTVYQCKRLMETEAHNLSAQATKKSYDENGVEKYRYLTSGHSNVCDKCAELERETKEKAIPVKNAIAGVNYNPMHPFCHCTTVPATRYDDEDESIYDMPYDEWYKQEIEPILVKGVMKESDDGLDIPSFANKKSASTESITSKLNISEGKRIALEKALNELRKLTDTTGNEYLTILDYESGENKFEYHTENKNEQVGFSNRMSISILLGQVDSFTCIHTHPKGTSFSLADLKLYLGNKAIADMCVTEPGGLEYYLYIQKEKRAFLKKKAAFSALEAKMKKKQKSYQKQGFTFSESLDMMWEETSEEEGWVYERN